MKVLKYFLVPLICLVSGIYLIKPVQKTQAAVLRQLPISARLTGVNDQNVEDGNYTFRFRIYDSETGSTVSWEETKTVAVEDGIFSTLLGSSTSLDSMDFNSDSLYLAIKVGSDDEMTPRKHIGSAAMALNADRLDGAHGSSSGGALTIPIADSSGNYNLGSGNITSTGALRVGSLSSASGSLSISTSLVPANSGLNLGSSASHWAALYVDDLVVGGAGLSSTTSEYYMVNSDAVADASAGYRIYRGPTVNSYATLQWNVDDGGFQLLANEGAITYANLHTAALTATTGAFAGALSGVTTLSMSGTLSGATTLNGATISGGTVSGGSLSATAVNGLSVASGTISSGAWNGTAVTVQYGGTGAATLTGLVLGNGTSAMTGLTASAGIAGALSDETGSGALVFGTSPTLTTPTVSGGQITLSADTDFVLSGGVNGVSFDTNVLSIDATNNVVGFGTATPNTGSGAVMDLAGPMYMSGEGKTIYFGSYSDYMYAAPNNYFHVRVGGTDNLTVKNTGNVGIGDTSPDYRLEIYDATNTPAFALSDDDVAHGVTTLVETDVFGHLSSISTTVGGLQITGLADATGTALGLKGVQSSDPTDTTPAISLIGTKASGTGVVDLGTTETVLQIANNDDTAAITVLGSGNVGIGTVTPAAKLDIAGTTDATQAIIRANATQSITSPLLTMLTSAGVELLRIHSDNTNNLFIGSSAGAANTITGGDNGLYDTFIGASAGKANTTGYDNTVVGSSAFITNINGNEDVAIGKHALYTNSSGDETVAIGKRALFANTTGDTNVAIGHNALDENTIGGNNIAIGSEALGANVSGLTNVAIGSEALDLNTGDANIAIGYDAMYFNSTPGYSVGIGGSVLYNNATGANNTAVGYKAGYGVNANSFANNSLFGYQAGLALTTGSNNILLGYQAGDTLTSGANNIIIGYDIDAPSVTGSNQLSIGNLIFGTGIDGTGTTVSTGSIGIGTAAPDTTLDIAGTVSYTPSATQVIDAVGDVILANAGMVVLNPDADYTLTSAATIADGKTGQLVYITSGNAEANTVTVQDQDTLPSSNLQLGAATRAIGAKDVLVLMFDGTDWLEVSFANN